MNEVFLRNRYQVVLYLDGGKVVVTERLHIMKKDGRKMRKINYQWILAVLVPT